MDRANSLLISSLTNACSEARDTMLDEGSFASTTSVISDREATDGVEIAAGVLATLLPYSTLLLSPRSMMPQTRETVKTYSTLSTTAPRLGRLVATTPGPGHLYRLLTQFVHSVRPSRRSHLTRLRRLGYQLGPTHRSASCFKGQDVPRLARRP